jgi:hypothetical protein
MDSLKDTAETAVGCPIRRSQGPRALAPRLSFSQRATSFIASRYQGIHQMPFSQSSPTPSPKRVQRSENSGQGSESITLSAAHRFAPTRRAPRHKPSLRRGNAPRRLRIPMPRPSQTERLGLLHGHDSLHDVKHAVASGQKSVVGPGHADLDHCQPITAGGPGPTRTADLTLIRRAL